MSSPHPTLSAWERDPHEGHYDADLHDWKLRVLWKHAGHDGRGMFHWEATRDDETEHGHEGFVEMEHAMADAEHFAADDASRRSALIAAMTDA